MPTAIPRETLHEIIRKLTPAIGRVLALRRPMLQSHEAENEEAVNIRILNNSILRNYNSALEEVLDPDIVEAVVRMNIHKISWDQGHQGSVECIIDDQQYVAALAFEGGISIEHRLQRVAHLQFTDLPALVAEAWAK